MARPQLSDAQLEERFFKKGRKALPPAEQVGPDFVGATPADMAAQEASARNALAVVESNAAALAQQLGYEGALTVGTLEDEIRFYQRRTVEAILETGKRLLVDTTAKSVGAGLNFIQKRRIEDRRRDFAARGIDIISLSTAESPVDPLVRFFEQRRRRLRR